MSFLQYKKNLNPIVALISTLIIMVFGLVMSTKTECSYFLLFNHFQSSIRRQKASSAAPPNPDGMKKIIPHNRISHRPSDRYT